MSKNLSIPATQLRAAASALVTTLLLVCQESPSERPGDGAISLERTACFGGCPVYKVVIDRDGDVSFVATGGEGEFTRVWRVPRDSVVVLERNLATADFGSRRDVGLRPDNCAVYATDNPTIILSVANQRSTHRVEYYTGCWSSASVPAESLPARFHGVGELAALTWLAARVDTVSGAIRLIDSLAARGFEPAPF